MLESIIEGSHAQAQAQGMNLEAATEAETKEEGCRRLSGVLRQFVKPRPTCLGAAPLLMERALLHLLAVKKMPVDRNVHRPVYERHLFLCDWFVSS